MIFDFTLMRLKEVISLLDVIMIGLFILLTWLMFGLTAWAGKVVEEGSEK